MPEEGMYPNINEILTVAVRRRLNSRIIADIEERYEKYGGEYVSPLKWPDGRAVNMCMINDSAQDAIEEVVDAIFNVIILAMKNFWVGSTLRHLVTAYEELDQLRVGAKK